MGAANQSPSREQLSLNLRHRKTPLSPLYFLPLQSCTNLSCINIGIKKLTKKGLWNHFFLLQMRIVCPLGCQTGASWWSQAEKSHNQKGRFSERVSYKKLSFPCELSICFSRCFKEIRINGIWQSFHIFIIC